MPKIRIGELSKSIKDDIHELIEWMKSKKISGSVFEISDKWSKHLGMDKHDYNSYRRMSTLLKIAHEKGLLRFEWVASKSPISKKVYKVYQNQSRNSLNMILSRRKGQLRFTN